MATASRILHEKILKVQRSLPARIETMGNCVANLELNFNLLSTCMAEAGKEGLDIPPEMLFILNRFEDQTKRLKEACVSGS